jgi:tetratricopeptide (TPR) repeat protein
MQAYLAHRGKDAFDLFGLPETASMEEIRRAFFDYSRRCAPWRFEGNKFESMRDKAEELYVAAARAFAELAATESRMALVNRRRTLREEQKRAPLANRFAIKTDLLDPEVQYRKGKALLDADRYKEALTFLEFAADCDAQNSTYGAELAWCRFLHSPNTAGAASMTALRDIMRIDPESGLAVYYAGEIARRRGDAREAEPLLRKACKMLAPDRRPVEALKLLLTR